MNDINAVIINRVEDIEKLRPFWEKNNFHPNADIDHYITIIKGKPEVVRPHIIQINEDGEPKTIIIGRIEVKKVEFALGYQKLLCKKMVSLTIIYGGIIGELSDDICNRIVFELGETLNKEKIEIVYLNSLATKSKIYKILTNENNRIGFKHFNELNVHWSMSFRKDVDEILKKVKPKHRYWLKRLPKVLEKDHAGKISYKTFSNIDQLGELVKDADDVGKETYQRSLGAGFIDNMEMRSRMAMTAVKGFLRAFILYINNEPCAFWIGTLYKRRFYLDYTGYKPDFKRYEPGTILFLEMIKRLDSKDLEEIDFGFGDAFYKERFGDKCWEEGSIYIFPRNVKGLGLFIMMETFNKVSKMLKRLLWKTKKLALLKRIWRNAMSERMRNNNR